LARRARSRNAPACSMSAPARALSNRSWRALLSIIARIKPWRASALACDRLDASPSRGD